jgi:hypothetical protein
VTGPGPDGLAGTAFRLGPLGLGLLDELVGPVTRHLEGARRILPIEAGPLVDLVGPVVGLGDGVLGASPGLLDDVVRLRLGLEDQLRGGPLALSSLLMGFLEQLVGVLAGLLEAAGRLPTIPLGTLDLGVDLAPQLL